MHDWMMFWLQDIQIPHTQIFIFSLFLSLSKLNANKATRIHVEKTTSKQYGMFDCDFVI